MCPLPGDVEAHDVHPERGDEEEVVHEGRDEHADRVRAAVDELCRGKIAYSDAA